MHSSVDGHLGSFHILVIVNSTAMNAVVHVCFKVVFSFFLSFFDISPGTLTLFEKLGGIFRGQWPSSEVIGQ